MSDKEEALKDMERRMEILRDDLWAMDMVAGELMEEKTEIEQDIAPKLAAIQNIEYRLTDLSNRKIQHLIQYRLGVRVIEGLNAEDPMPDYSMEVQ